MERRWESITFNKTRLRRANKERHRCLSPSAGVGNHPHSMPSVLDWVTRTRGALCSPWWWTDLCKDGCTLCKRSQTSGEEETTLWKESEPEALAGLPERSSSLGCTCPWWRPWVVLPGNNFLSLGPAHTCPKYYAPWLFYCITTAAWAGNCCHIFAGRHTRRRNLSTTSRNLVIRVSVS